MYAKPRPNYALAGMTSDPRTGVVAQIRNVHIVMEKEDFSDINTAVIRKLNLNVDKFYPDAGGILMGYQAIKMNRSISEVFTTTLLYPIHIRAKFYLFKPTAGTELMCVVTHKEEGRVKCRAHGMFQVEVLSPPGCEEMVFVGQSIVVHVEAVEQMSWQEPKIVVSLVEVSGDNVFPLIDIVDNLDTTDNAFDSVTDSGIFEHAALSRGTTEDSIRRAQEEVGSRGTVELMVLESSAPTKGEADINQDYRKRKIQELSQVGKVSTPVTKKNKQAHKSLISSSETFSNSAGTELALTTVKQFPDKSQHSSAMPPPSPAKIMTKPVAFSPLKSSDVSPANKSSDKMLPKLIPNTVPSQDELDSVNKLNESQKGKLTSKSSDPKVDGITKTATACDKRTLIRDNQQRLLIDQPSFSESEAEPLSQSLLIIESDTEYQSQSLLLPQATTIKNNLTNTNVEVAKPIQDAMLKKMPDKSILNNEEENGAESYFEPAKQLNSLTSAKIVLNQSPSRNIDASRTASDSEDRSLHEEAVVKSAIPATSDDDSLSVSSGSDSDEDTVIAPVAATRSIETVKKADSSSTDSDSDSSEKSELSVKQIKQPVTVNDQIKTASAAQVSSASLMEISQTSNSVETKTSSSSESDSSSDNQQPLVQHKKKNSPKSVLKTSLNASEEGSKINSTVTEKLPYLSSIVMTRAAKVKDRELVPAGISPIMKTRHKSLLLPQATTIKKKLTNTNVEVAKPIQDAMLKKMPDKSILNNEEENGAESSFEPAKQLNSLTSAKIVLNQSPSRNIDASRTASDSEDRSSHEEAVVEAVVKSAIPATSDDDSLSVSSGSDSDEDTVIAPVAVSRSIETVKKADSSSTDSDSDSPEKSELSVKQIKQPVTVNDQIKTASAAQVSSASLKEISQTSNSVETKTSSSSESDSSSDNQQPLVQHKKKNSPKSVLKTSLNASEEGSKINSTVTEKLPYLSSTVMTRAAKVKDRELVPAGISPIMKTRHKSTALGKSPGIAYFDQVMASSKILSQKSDRKPGESDNRASDSKTKKPKKKRKQVAGFL